ncbi:MAG: hypothetical protein ACXW1W_18555 [Methylococcaceae bacterium]
MSKQTLNNQQKPGIISPEKSMIISESSLLVPLTKSKKLTAIRKQSQTIEKNPVQSGEIRLSGQYKETGGLLTEAQEQINTKINELMTLYPSGMKNKMFAIKYGAPESIKQMTMKAIFTHLVIVKPKKFALIESQDYFGNDTTQIEISNPDRNV